MFAAPERDKKKKKAFCVFTQHHLHETALNLWHFFNRSAFITLPCCVTYLRLVPVSVPSPSGHQGIQVNFLDKLILPKQWLDYQLKQTSLDVGSVAALCLMNDSKQMFSLGLGSCWSLLLKLKGKICLKNLQTSAFVFRKPFSPLMIKPFRWTDQVLSIHLIYSLGYTLDRMKVCHKACVSVTSSSGRLVTLNFPCECECLSLLVRPVKGWWPVPPVASKRKQSMQVNSVNWFFIVWLTLAFTCRASSCSMQVIIQIHQIR